MKYKLILLDRDGVINYPAEPGKYIFRLHDFIMFRDVSEFFRRLINLGVKLAIVTNQRGIALGLYTALDVESIHASMLAICNMEKSQIKLYYCPHDVNVCFCRKPGPALIERAMRDHQVNSYECLFIGDQPSDGQAAERAGVEFIQIQRLGDKGFINQEALLECLSKIEATS